MQILGFGDGDVVADNLFVFLPYFEFLFQEEISNSHTTLSRRAFAALKKNG